MYSIKQILPSFWLLMRHFSCLGRAVTELLHAFLFDFGCFLLLSAPGGSSCGSSSSILSRGWGSRGLFATKFSDFAERFFAVTSVTPPSSIGLKAFTALCNGFVTVFLNTPQLLHWCYNLLHHCYINCYTLLLHYRILFFNLLERKKKKCNSKQPIFSSRTEISKNQN